VAIAILSVKAVPATKASDSSLRETKDGKVAVAVDVVIAAARNVMVLDCRNFDRAELLLAMIYSCWIEEAMSVVWSPE